MWSLYGGVNHETRALVEAGYCESHRTAILGGIFMRKPRWGLSWHGRMLVAAAALVAGLLVI